MRLGGAVRRSGEDHAFAVLVLVLVLVVTMWADAMNRALSLVAAMAAGRPVPNGP